VLSAPAGASELGHIVLRVACDVVSPLATHRHTLQEFNPLGPTGLALLLSGRFASPGTTWLAWALWRHESRSNRACLSLSSVGWVVMHLRLQARCYRLGDDSARAAICIAFLGQVADTDPRPDSCFPWQPPEIITHLQHWRTAGTAAQHELSRRPVTFHAPRAGPDRAICWRIPLSWQKATIFSCDLRSTHLSAPAPAPLAGP